MNIGEKIKALRQKKGLTLEEVGNFVGVSKSTVLKWERGRIQNMRRDKIAKLAEILGTTPDLFINEEEEENTPKAVKFELSPHEQKVIEAYRSNPNMQEAVDKLLGVEPEGRTVEEDIADTIRRIEKERTPIG